MKLDSPITVLPGIGTSFATKLEKLGVTSLFDLLYHLPSRYEDRSLVSPVSQVQPGETVTVKGTITAIKNEFTKSGKFIQKATLFDSTGSLPVIWFNQTFLVKALAGQSVSLYGKADFFSRQVALVSPDYEITSDQHTSLHTGRIVPVYPETAGLSSKWLRTKIFSLLSTLPETDPWPAPGLPGWRQALFETHFPSANSEPQINNYKQRLAFDELFLLQLKSRLFKESWSTTHLSHPLHPPQTKILDFISRLPFSLTSSQNRSLQEILTDLSGSTPMNRLLEGDVGSGKTVVAAVAAYTCYLNGFQTVILAPTQILAAQHHQTLTSLFRPYQIELSLLTANSKKPKAGTNPPAVVVGTHALLSTKNRSVFQNVGLVVIDEQHRFGVAQRGLAASLGQSPHILTMTATPIPRSVALTMFGHLDLSLLTDKPLNRLPVKTWVVPESKRQSAYTWVKEQMVKSASQAFWVCPLINDSETQISVKAVTTEYEHLKQIFPSLRLGLLHGRLKASQKTDVINRFRSGDIDMLVATPVVEVGLDIPNAAIMVIEAAEKFGLAQLHQLRGRVGRADIQSFCLLFTSDATDSPRLKSLETLDSGTQLAEMDLKFRGPGEVFGTAQHGFPQFKVASYADLGLLETAKTTAGAILPQLDKYPLLQDLVKNDKIALIQPN